MSKQPPSDEDLANVIDMASAAKLDSAEFDAALDRAIDLCAVLQKAMIAADPHSRLTRFEVVSALVATMATCMVTMEDEPFEAGLAAIRSADMIVMGLRHSQRFRDRKKGGKEEQTRVLLKEAFWRARAATIQ